MSNMNMIQSITKTFWNIGNDPNGEVNMLQPLNKVIIGSSNGLSSVWHQAVTWTNADMLITHWGRVTHICVSKITIIDSDNGLSPDRRQAIIWISAGVLLIGPLSTNFSGILIEIYTFSSTKMHLKMSSGKCRPFCLGLNVLIAPCRKT